MDKDIFKKLELADFLATDADIEALARDRQDALERDGRASGTYLKVLVALTAQEIGTRTTPLARRRGRGAVKTLPAREVKDHLEITERVNARCYGAVLRAVATPDLAPVEGLEQAESNRRTLERNRRTNYARTAATALRLFVSSGGDVRDLDVATITKGRLRELAEVNVPPQATLSVQRLERAAKRDVDSAAKEAEQLAVFDTSKALDFIHEAVEQLQAVEQRIRDGDIAPMRQAA